VDFDFAIGLEAGGAIDGEELDGASFFDAGEGAGVDACGWGDEVCDGEVDGDGGDV
jgi:hypothetical protein